MNYGMYHSSSNDFAAEYEIDEARAKREEAEEQRWRDSEATRRVQQAREEEARELVRNKAAVVEARKRGSDWVVKLAQAFEQEKGKAYVAQLGFTVRELHTVGWGLKFLREHFSTEDLIKAGLTPQYYHLLGVPISKLIEYFSSAELARYNLHVDPGSLSAKQLIRDLKR